MIISKNFPQIEKRHWATIIKTAFAILFKDWYNMRHFPGI